MKKIIIQTIIVKLILTLTFLQTNSLFCQTSTEDLEFIYYFQRNNYESKYVLRFDEKYTIWEETQDLMPRADANINFERFRKYQRRKVYKSTSDSIVLSNYDIMAESFYLKEQLENHNWQLLDSTSVVLNKKCNIAKTEFRGRNYYAYYDPNIPIPNGPWKFHGLPGLILKVITNENGEYFNIECVEIKKGTSKGNLERIYSKFLNKNKRKFISWNSFLDKISVFIENVIKYHKSSFDEDDDGEEKSGFRLLNYLEVFHRAQKETIWY